MVLKGDRLELRIGIYYFASTIPGETFVFNMLDKIDGLKWGLSSVPVLLLLLLFLSHRNDRRELFPGRVSTKALSVYNDSADGGASKILPTDDVRRLSYELFDTKDFFIPFVGYSINLRDEDRGLSLTDYNRVELAINVAHRQTCYVLFNMYVEEGAPYDSIKDVSLSCELPLFPNDSLYTLDLNEFYFPDWWLYENGLESDSVDRTYLKRIRTVNIHLGAQDNNYSNEIYFHRLTLVKDKKHLYMWLGIGSLIWYGILLAIASITKQHKMQLAQREKIVVPYETLDSLTHSVEDLRLIVQYIGVHYTEAGLSIKDVAEQCALSTIRVSELLSSHFQEVSFKQYLNMLRVYEAKRLLLESNLNISEIGFAVGFANVTHFNRTFKKILETTPSALRSMRTEKEKRC